jgi:hypothetical protein
VTRTDPLAAVAAVNPLRGDRLNAYVATFDHEGVIASVLARGRARRMSEQTTRGRRRLHGGILLPLALVVVATASAAGIGYHLLASSPNRHEFTVPSNLPAAGRDLKPVKEITGPYGGTATIEVGGIIPMTSYNPSPSGNVVHVVAKSRCWRVSFSDGESLGTCLPLTKTKDPESWVAVQHLGSDTFIVVQSEPRIGTAIARIEFRLANGHVLNAKPIDGIVVFAIPRNALNATKSQLGFLASYDAEGRRAVYDNNFAHVQTNRQPVYYRSCPPGSGCDS